MTVYQVKRVLQEAGFTITSGNESPVVISHDCGLGYAQELLKGIRTVLLRHGVPLGQFREPDDPKSIRHVSLTYSADLPGAEATVWAFVHNVFDNDLSEPAGSHLRLVHSVPVDSPLPDHQSWLGAFTDLVAARAAREHVTDVVSAITYAAQTVLRDLEYVIDVDARLELEDGTPVVLMSLQCCEMDEDVRDALEELQEQICKRLRGSGVEFAFELRS